jgi:hypothetical protein
MWAALQHQICVVLRITLCSLPALTKGPYRHTSRWCKQLVASVVRLGLVHPSDKHR